MAQGRGRSSGVAHLLGTWKVSPGESSPKRGLSCPLWDTCWGNLHPCPVKHGFAEKPRKVGYQLPQITKSWIALTSHPMRGDTPASPGTLRRMPVSLACQHFLLQFRSTEIRQPGLTLLDCFASPCPGSAAAWCCSEGTSAMLGPHSWVRVLLPSGPSGPLFPTIVVNDWEEVRPHITCLTHESEFQFLCHQLATFLWGRGSWVFKSYLLHIFPMLLVTLVILIGWERWDRRNVINKYSTQLKNQMG